MTKGSDTKGSHQEVAPVQVSRDVESLAQKFALTWAKPDVDQFMELLHPDVRLTQPLSAPISGKSAARREFELMFRLFPDLHGEVDHWGADGNHLMIAWRLRATIGRELYEWRISDHLRIEDGLIIERDALYDSIALMTRILRSGPSAWLKSLKLLGWIEAR